MSLIKAIRLLSVIAIVTFCLQIFSNNDADVDIWGNVGFVKVMPWHAEYHYTNTFSYTDTQHEWINHEWLGEYIYNLSYRTFGNSGLILLKTLLLFMLMGIIYIAINKDDVSGPVTFLYLLLTISTIGYGASIRPHHFTYLFYAMFLLILKYRPKQKYIILTLFPALGLLWTNLHGAFFIGIILLLIFGTIELIEASISRQNKTYGITLLVSAILFILLSCVNPYTLHLWSFIFHSAAKVRPYLSEWAAFNPIKDFYSHPDFIILTLISILSILFSSKPKNIKWLCILALSLASALMIKRNIPLFAITAAFVVPPHIDNIAGKTITKLFQSINQIAIASTLTLFVIISTYYGLTFNKNAPLQVEVDREKFPVDTIEFMQLNNISGNALVFFDWAEYSIWHLYPKCKVFMDGRFVSAYSAPVINAYIRFIYQQDSKDDALNKYPTDIVLLHKGNPATRKMLTLNDWQLVYTNNISCLFLKKNQNNKTILKNIEAGNIQLPSKSDNSYFP